MNLFFGISRREQGWKARLPVGQVSQRKLEHGGLTGVWLDDELIKRVHSSNLQIHLHRHHSILFLLTKLVCLLHHFCL